MKSYYSNLKVTFYGIRILFGPLHKSHMTEFQTLNKSLLDLFIRIRIKYVLSVSTRLFLLYCFTIVNNLDPDP